MHHRFSRRRLKARSSLLVLIASTTATVIIRTLSHDSSGFFVHRDGLEHDSPWQTGGWMALSIPIGLLGGLLGRLFVTVAHKVRRRVSRLPSGVAMAAAGGVTGVVGAVTFAVTGHAFVWGTGEWFVRDLLEGKWETETWPVVVLFIGKSIAITAAFAAGGCGGLFSPVLTLGALYGNLMAALHLFIFKAAGVQHDWERDYQLPGASLTIRQIRLAGTVTGMASLFGAVFRCPITAILLIYEMTREHGLILPIMMSSVLSVVIANQLPNESFFDAQGEFDNGRETDGSKGSTSGSLLFLRSNLTMPPVSPKEQEKESSAAAAADIAAATSNDAPSASIQDIRPSDPRGEPLFGEPLSPSAIPIVTEKDQPSADHCQPSHGAAVDTAASVRRTRSDERERSRVYVVSEETHTTGSVSLCPHAGPSVDQQLRLSRGKGTREGETNTV
ncbi:unnamed protein product [Vitrella brassicaformis CCMP3155]|uniref:Chloride channel protein n=2 Tax=Vitrella brassicaformis TaxID=1169539 RepID=A0A0G4F5Z4_VITBC|nr:unnamed protein product [Vitrella brassicaformis CCMP3155]|eukprot:CEM07643.1 unnamed protein product [Vitrella brassicaformis CCMP3155]